MMCVAAEDGAAGSDVGEDRLMLVIIRRSDSKRRKVEGTYRELGPWNKEYGK